MKSLYNTFSLSFSQFFKERRRSYMLSNTEKIALRWRIMVRTVFKIFPRISCGSCLEFDVRKASRDIIVQCTTAAQSL